MQGRRRSSATSAEPVAGPGMPLGSGQWQRQPSPMRGTEYSSAYRDGVSSPKADSVLTKNAADRVRRSDSGSKDRTSGPHSPLSGFSPTKSSANVGLHSFGAKSKAADSPREVGSILGLLRQPSDKSKSKTLGLTGELPGPVRGGRVSTFSSQGVSAVLSQTMPASSYSSPPARGRGAMGTAAPEREIQMMDFVVGYGSSSIQGMRNYQEDTVAFLPGGSTLAGGVFDGHGGDQVSKELEKVLLQSIMRGINDLTAHEQGALGPSPAAIQAAIHQAYTQTNHEIGMRLAAAGEAGSCAVTFVLARAAGVLHIFCANAGDCRAVLYTGPPGARRAVRLSEDHKPHPQVCPQEITRVTNAGGCVLWGRVQGCLAVSRAFGDKALAPFVIADPYITARPVGDQDLFLYLASDGVTDMVDDNVGAEIVAKQLAAGQTSSQAAHALVRAAYDQGSSDNISAAVIRLRRR